MPNSQMGKKHFQPPDTHMQMLFLGTAWIAGLIFCWEEDDFISATKCNRWRMHIYGRFWDHYSVTDLHALLLSTDQKYLNHVISGPATCQARGWSASFAEVKGKIPEDFSKARNLPWGLQQQTPKCSRKILLNKTLYVDKMVFFQVSISQC